MPKIKELPKSLRPFSAHGIDIDYVQDEDEAYAPCPSCGRSDRKFSINVDSSKFHCYICGLGGAGAIDFLRWLWNESDKRSNDYTELSQQRRLLNAETPMHFGVCRSIITNEWIIPGFNAKVEIVQVYQYVKQFNGKWSAIATAEVGHGLFGVQLFDHKKPDLFVLEGWSDAAAIWEVLRSTKKMEGENGDGTKYALTASEPNSLYAHTNVIAVPGAGTFSESWCPLFSGKRVFLLYDSDHPKLHCKACKKTYSKVLHSKCPKCSGQLSGPEIPPVGCNGMKRTAQILANAEQPPESISILRWGANGYDESLVSGYDVRDFLTEVK
jgi:hypothetical protein